MKSILLALIVLISFQTIELEKRSLLNDKVELLVPKDFKEMTKEMLEFKYRGANKPTFVLTNEEATVNIAINMINNPADSSVIKNYEAAIKNSFQKSFPDADWKGDGVTYINGKKVGYLKVITQGIDQPIYNYLFITDVDGKLLTGTFNCTKKLLPEWQDASEKIVQSLVIKQ